MAIDVNALEAEARFLIGGLPESVLTSAIMQIIIQRGIAKYSDADSDYCKVLYYTIIESLRYLIREQTWEGADAGLAGSVISRREKEGSVEVEERYASGVTEAPSWEDLLEDFLKNPQLVCDELARTSGSGTVLIGDGDRDGFETSYESRNRWDKSSYNMKNVQRWPWRSNR